MERRTTYPKPYFYRSRSELYSAFRKTGAEVALNHFQVNMSSAITPTPSANEAYAPPHRAGAAPRILLLIAVAVIIVITAIRTWIWWRSDSGISFASGVMITMATDLKQGVFYRPLYDSRGYGGTRYFPLFFCLHALLLELGLPILASAYLLSAAAMLLLMLGTFLLLRRLAVEPWLAGCSAVMVLAAASVQMSLSTPQSDGLAAALNIWGLAAIAKPPYVHRRILLAALLFTLAWSAKLTTVFGLAAACIWLLATGCRRVAWLLAAETGCGYLLVAGAMIVASHGRVVEIFRACASGGDKLEVHRQWLFANGVHGRLYRSCSSFIRCPGVSVACVSRRFRETAAKPAGIVLHHHNGDHDNDFRFSRDGSEPPARRASCLCDSAGCLGRECRLSAATATRCLCSRAVDPYRSHTSIAACQSLERVVPPTSIPASYCRHWPYGKADPVGKPCHPCARRAVPLRTWILGWCNCCESAFRALKSRSWKACGTKPSVRWC